MSPDIEWHVGEEAEQETVVKTQPRPPSRWNRILIGLMVLAGVSLGVVYSRLPEPSHLVAPTAVPTETPPPLPPLGPVIEQEALALAAGNYQAFLNLQDTSDAQWQQAEQAAFQAWGTPSDSNPIFTILDSGVIQPDQGWADVVQYRNGQYFRETRFYRAYHFSWVRTRPSQSIEFWSDAQTDQTAHFNLIYSARDADQAHLIANQWEREYALVCSKLSCTEDLAAPPKLTLNLQPQFNDPFHTSRNGFGQSFDRYLNFGLDASQDLSVTLSSPSFTGLYYSTADMNTLGQNPRLDNLFDWTVLYYIVYSASGGSDRWTNNHDGVLFIAAIGNWLRLPRNGQPAAQTVPQRGFDPNFFDQQPALTLTDLWSWRPDATRRQRELAVFEAYSLIQFIDHTYGEETVLKFFHGLRTAQSLSSLIEATGVTYSEFETKWIAWLDHLRANT